MYLKWTYASVDDLTMGYSGNRLTSLTDNAAEVTLESSMDIPSGWFSGRDFGYDAAGAVTRDVSRNIANIDYYFNGMPSIVGTMEGDCISYVYTAAGEKLAETVWNGNRTTRRDYIGPFEFIGGQLLRINLPQGYIDSIGTLHAYIPDIQSNIVGVYEAREGNTELEQLNEYYAYGGLTADSDGQDANRRKHTAKELTTDFGINTYDFTARSQYPMASRFDQPDRLSYVKPWNTPYAFCGGDPINRTDPTGNDYELIIDDENKTMTVSAVYYACTPDMKSLNKAIAFWNDQSGIHQVGEYTIMFELETVEVKDYGYDGSGNKANDNTRRSAAKLMADSYNNISDAKNGNSFTEHTRMKASKAGTASQNHIDINRETAQETTYLHEIGHTLGINHDSNGIMTESANDLARGKFLTGNNIVEMVKNTFSRDAERSVGKGYLKIINKTIERLYLFNYHKLPR